MKALFIIFVLNVLGVPNSNFYEQRIGMMSISTDFDIQ